VLHVLEHLEEERTFVPCRLGVGTGILFACGCRVECHAQQGIFAFERVNGVLHQHGIRCGRVCRVLLRAAGARRRILERGMARAAGFVLSRGMQRIACSDQFCCINVVIRVETEATRIDGALERAAGHAAGACRIRDGEPGHGWALAAAVAPIEDLLEMVEALVKPQEPILHLGLLHRHALDPVPDGSQAGLLVREQDIQAEETVGCRRVHQGVSLRARAISASSQRRSSVVM